jgi:galactokinase
MSDYVQEAATAARRVFHQEFGREPAGVAYAPGRVNLIGEHTDYNDGFVLPMAIEQGIAAAYAPNAERVLRVHASVFGETRELAFDGLREGALAATGWFRYVAGLAAVAAEAGAALAGVDMALASTLPVAAGLSSSAALQMSTARALAAAAGASWNPAAAARIAQRSEHVFTGVACGIMDQMAVACGRRGAALLLDCRSLAIEDVPLPSDTRIVVVYSGVTRALADSAYNDRRAACERAVAAVQRIDPAVMALRDVGVPMLLEAKPLMDDTAYRRAAHVVPEIDRPGKFAAALAAGDLATAGSLMHESHRSLRDLYEVSCAELDLLVGIASELPGCHGARLTGAGFGGSIVALVDASSAASFSTAIAARYRGESGLEPRVIVSSAAQGARVL